MKPEDKPIFDRLTDEHLLGLTIYLEGRNQPYEAQVGVAWVVMLRVRQKRRGDTPPKTITARGVSPQPFYRTMHEVILKPNQFSEYNSNDPEYVLAEGIAANWDAHYQIDKALRIAEGIAAGVINGLIKNPFGRDDVLYFREEHVHPNTRAVR